MSRYVDKRGWSTGKTVALILLIAFVAVIYFTAVKPAMKAPATTPAEAATPTVDPLTKEPEPAKSASKDSKLAGQKTPSAAPTKPPVMISPITGKPTT